MNEWFEGLDRSSGTIPPIEALIAMVAAALLSTLLGVVYLKVHPNKGYGRSLVLTQVTLSVVIASVLMVIGDSIAVAFGAFGILGVVRFRTDFPDPRDSASLISAIAVGMACGLGEYRMAFVATMVLIAILGAGWLWVKDSDDEYWRDLAMKGRGSDKKKKKEAETKKPEDASAPTTEPAEPKEKEII